MRSVKKSLIAGTLLVALLFSACSILPQPAAMEEPSAALENADANKAQGGDLFIAMPVEVESLDPITANTEDLINLLSLIYETPMKYEADGRLVNNLVENWEMDDTKTKFTFTLRDNIFFSDGTTALTSDDVIFSASKVMQLSGQALDVTNGAAGDNPEADEPDAEATPSPQATEAPQEGDDGGEGNSAEAEMPKNRYEQFNQYVSGLEKIDDKTFVLTMNKAGNYGLHFMTFPVMNKELSWEETPVGTGPFKVDSYTEGEEMVLVQNDLWRKEKPYIEKIVAKAVTGTAQKLEFEQTSIVDFVTTDVLYSGKYRSPQKTQVTDYMTNYYDCLIPNQLSSKMKDVNVRQAISYALDRREILSTVLLNHGVPTNLPIAPDYFAYDSKYKISDYDRKTAKDLLEKAGYRTEPDGEGKQLELDLIFPNDRTQPYRREAAKAIQKQLADVGISIRILDPVDSGGRSDPEGYKKLLEGGNFDLAYCSYYLDIAPNISYLLGTGGEGNYGNVQSEEIDQAIAKCEEAVTDAELISSYESLQRVLTERVPQIGLYFRMNSIICDDGIKDIKKPRQNAIFSNIADWNISYVGEKNPQETPESGAMQSDITGQSVEPNANAQDGEITVESTME